MKFRALFKRPVVVFTLSFLMFSLAGCKKKRDVFSLPYVATLGKLSDDAFGLVFTSSMEGYIEPCGCTSEPLGGIARFTMMFKDLSVALKNNIALVDAGNLLFDSPSRNDADRCQDDEKINILLSALSSLGLKSTVIGPLDNARGIEYRDRAYQSHGLAARENIPDANSDHFFARISLEKTSMLSYGVFAVNNNEGADLKNLRTRVAGAMHAIKEKYQPKLMVVISQLPKDATKEVFLDVNDVDIVILGQTIATKPPNPEKLGAKGPWLIEGVRQGQFFSMLLFQNLSRKNGSSLVFDTRNVDRVNRENLLIARIDVLKKQAEGAAKERQKFLNDMIKRAESEIIALKKEPAPSLLNEAHFIFHSVPITKKIDADPAIQEKVDHYDESIPLLVKKCEEGIECEPAEPGASSYVGANVCKNCHQEAFAVWKNSVYLSKGRDDNGREITRSIGHSKAWATLVDAKKEMDRSCIGCHSIGFMEKGGYCRAGEVDFRVDVQCESCHGAGSRHAQTGDKQFIRRKVEESTCRACHQVPHIPSYESFNYDEKVVKILGKGHGENLLKELSHSAKK